MTRQLSTIILSNILILVMIVVGVLSVASPVIAQPNPEINYQGKLTDSSGVAVANGTYNMRFWLLQNTSQATSSAIWAESLTGSNKVQVTNGLFSVMLGSTSALTSVDFNQTLYLGVEIGGSGGSPTWDGEMLPRKPLGTVPAAFEAFKLGGVASTSFLRSDQTDTASGLITFTSGLLSTASSTVSGLSFDTATGTRLVLGSDSLVDLTGTGLVNSGGSLSVSSSSLNLNLEGLTDVTTMTENYGDLLYWNGSAWADIATSSLKIAAGDVVGLGSAATRNAEDTLTNGSNLPDGAAVTAYVTGLGYITDDTSVAKNHLTNSGTLSFDWDDSEIANNLTISGGTIGSSTISAGSTWTTSGTLTIGDGGDRIDIASDTWDVTNGVISGATWNGVAIGDAYLTKTGNWTGTLDGYEAAALLSGGFSSTSADYWVTTKSIDSLSDVAAMTENYGDLLYWNGSAWADIATTSLGLGNGTFLGLSDTPSSYTANRIMYTNSGATGLTDSASLVFTGTKLGVGSTTPSATLSVTGNTWLDSNVISFASSSASSLLLRYFTEATSTIKDNSSFAFTIATSTSASPIFRIDTSGSYANTLVDGSFTVNNGAIAYDATTNQTTIENLALGTMTFADDAGAVTWTDMGITAGAASGDPMSYTAQLDGNALFTVYGEADGSGGLQDGAVGIGTTTPWARFSITGDSTDATKPLFTVASSTGTSILHVTHAGKVGVGTTSPAATFAVSGDTYISGTATAVSSRFTHATTTNLAVSGVFRDSTGSAGTNGKILQTTGTGVQWVATSTLGIVTTADDLTNNSIEDLQDVAAMTENYGDLLYWNGSAWADIATSSLKIAASDVVGLGSAATRNAEDTLTNGSNLPDGAAVTAYVTGLGYITDDTSVAKNHLTNSGTLSFDWDDSEIANNLTISGGTIGSSTISSGSTWTTSGTLTIGDGGDRIDIASDTWDVTNGVISGATWNGADVDVSDYTNLAVSATGLTLSGDSVALTAGYNIPLTASTTAWQSALASTHAAVTLTGEDYLSLATQQITANAIDPDNLSASDFGSFTCNGTTCTVDTGAISNTMLTNSSVSFGGVSVALGSSDATPAFNLADATGLPISTGVSGLGANVATFLATPSSANLASAVTGETGSGALVFGTNPTLSGATLNGTLTFDATGENNIEALIFDADAESISGIWEVQDDVVFNFGTDADWSIEYDEAVDDQLLFTTAKTGTAAITDPMFEILVGTTPTADQQVFGVAKGTQAANTALFTVDEDGDVDVTGNITVAGTVDGKDIATNAAMLNEAETIGSNWVNTANPWADNEVVDTLTLSGGTIGSSTISSGSTWTTSGTLTIGDGGDRIDIASDTWDVTNGVISGATWNGADVDVSDYTNLAVSATGLTLSGDSVALTAGYNIPLTASTTAWQSALASTHAAVTLTGEDYLSLATQQITANAIDPDNLSASDFGSFTCNGTTCTVDTGAISNTMLTNSSVSFGGVSVALGSSDATPAFNLADATGLPISTGVSGLGANVATFLATPSSANLASAVTGETGSGALVFGTNPTLSGATLNGTLTFDATGENNIEALIFDADAESISGIWEVQDDVVFNFGTDADWSIEYDEAVDDQLLFTTAKTGTAAITDPMFEILVGTTPTADQQVFGVAKGTQAANTALFTVDEDGDVDVTGNITVAGTVDGKDIATNAAMLNEAETIGSNWVNTANPWADNEVVDTLTLSGGTIGSSTISSGSTWTTSGTLTIGDGGDRIDIASDTWDVTNGVISGATWNGADVDVSDYTNLAVSATGLTLSGDSVALTAGYNIPLTASTTAWQSALASTHAAVTLTGEDYLSLATQQITANAIDPDNLSASDFGSFTCNGTTCTVDTGAISNTMLTNSSVSFGGVSVALGSSDATPAFNLADATGLPISTGVSGLGANVATFLATPSSANLASAVTGETGSGALVFGTNPTLSGATLNGTLTFDATGENNVEALIFDADAESISGIWEVQDDVVFNFGTDADWSIEYDEAVDDQLLFTTAKTGTAAITDPMFEILVGTTPTADQQVFGIGKGTQAANTALFTVDEDGDVDVTGNITVAGTVDGKDIATNAAMLNEAETIGSNWVNTANPWADNEVVDTLTLSGGTIGSSTISSGSTWTTSGTLTIGDGGDRIDIASNTWDVTNGVISGATWNGTDVDVSDYTNLAVSATGLTLSGDSIALTAGYNIPLTASTTAWQSALASTHAAVTLTGEDYLSLATQQITANAIDPDNLSASDFGSFTCNGTTCTVDSSAISNAMLANSSVSFGGVSVALGASDATPAFNLADATGLPISTGVSGLGANVATFLATPSSANLISAVTDETGSGVLVFGTNPTLSGATLNGTLTFDATGENNIEALIFDADAESISGIWEVQDDVVFNFGTDADWSIEYDEAVDDQLLFTTAKTGTAAITDPMFEILVGTTPTADQQVFGVAKGTQAANTALFTVDEDGDVDVTGNITVAGTVDGKDIATNAAMLNEAETIGSNWVNTANPWADNEVVDTLTLSGGTIGSSTISSGSTWTTSGTLTIGDGGDRIDIASNTWDVTNGVISGATWNGTAIGDAYLTKTGDWTGTLDSKEGSYYLANSFSTTSADYWVTTKSIDSLSDVAAMTENYGDLLYWNGTAWADIATTSLGLGNGTFLGLSDTPSSYTASAIPFVSGSALAFDSTFVYDGTNLGIGTAAPGAMLDIYGASNGLRLSYDGSNYSELSVDSNGVLSVSSTGGTGSNLALGSGLAEDLAMLLNGSAADWYVGLDDTDDLLKIGLGSEVGTSTLIQISSATTTFNTALRATTTSASPALTIVQSGTGDILNLFDGATEVLSVLDGGKVGIGSTTPNAKLSVQNTGFSGTGVFGLDQYLQSTNSVASAVQYGDRFYLDAANTATTSIVGAMFRIKDSTAYGNTIRGLEVQTNRGTNTQGENTALSAFARTFGVRAVTSGDAGGTYEPAAGFFETEGTTQGNAMRGYSDTITTATLLSLFQASSTFTGTGLEMNFGNTTGSFSSTSSKFLDFQNAGTSVFTVSAFGTTTIGDGTTNNMASLQIGFGGICVDNDGTCTATSTGWVVADGFATGNSDLAEMYFSDTELEAGEVVVMTGSLSVDRATTDSTLPILGVVSTNPGLTIGSDDTSLNAEEKPYPIALSGRVPIKLSNENGEIKAGDELMLSSLPGIAMKAASSSVGTIIGVALEDFDDTRLYSDTYLNQFGDSMVDPVYEPIFTEYDPRINDGCYFGGGEEIDEAPCVPLTATTSEGIVAEANEIAEQESVAEQLEALEEENTLTRILADGREVKVGQIVMFVEKSERWLSTSQVASLGMLMSTSSLANVGQNPAETIFDRLVALADRFVDGVLSVFTLKADRVETKELCVDGVCVDAAALQQLLNNSATQTSSPSTPSETNDGEEEVSPETEPTPIEEEAATETTETETVSEEVVEDELSTEEGNEETSPTEEEVIATVSEPEEEEPIVQEPEASAQDTEPVPTETE